MNTNPAPELLLPELDWPAGIKAVFTTRAGGVSPPPWDSLNLADHVEDAPERVFANRSRLQQQFPGLAEPVWLQQVHGRTLSWLQKKPPAAKPIADAAATRQPGIPCPVLVADCVPILLASLSGKVVAAIHAGWRGLAAGIIPRVLAQLQPHAPFIAWIGPSICGNCYEVGAEVPAQFSSCQKRFRPGGDEKFFCDLQGISEDQLQENGVSRVIQSGLCTFEDQRFFSFRRDGITGRCAALIWIDPAR